MDAFLISILVFGLAMVLCLYLGERNRPRSSSSDDGTRAPDGAEDGGATMLPLPIPSDVIHPDQMLVWATQIPALRFVSDRGSRGTYYTPLKLIFIELARRHPEICDGCTFQGWVQFYVRIGLFHFEDDSIHLTAAGREFLSMLLDRLACESKRPLELGTKPSAHVS